MECQNASFYNNRGMKLGTICKTIYKTMTSFQWHGVDGSIQLAIIVRQVDLVV